MVDKGDVIISSMGKVYLKNTQAKNNIDISAKETEIMKTSCRKYDKYRNKKTFE